MRLPLAHPPPGHLDPELGCDFLLDLADASLGLPLGMASQRLMSGQGRGRHGNALQWHLGLDIRDSRPELDWENRIEIKLVSVWRKADGGWSCDKLKVCDHGVDPWHKLSNVLWVLADRMSRVILATRMSPLRGLMRDAMARAWSQDPHFGAPDLFVESRDRGQAMSPAYYLSASIMRQAVVEPASRGALASPLTWDPVTAARWRKEGRPPVWVLVDPGQALPRCPVCRAPLSIENTRNLERGWLPLVHAPNSSPCSAWNWVGIDGAHVPPSPVLSREEQAMALRALSHEEPLVRLVDRCPEPVDHGHL